MITEKKFELYDRIVAATYTNIFIESSKSKYIILDSYNKNYIDKVFFEVAKYVGALTNKKIMVKTNIISFILLKIKKNRKQFCRFQEGAGDPIPVQEIGNFEIKEFNVDESIFEEIYKTYYAKEGIYND